MAFSIRAVLIFPVMENPPDLAYDCIKGSRILGENETKQNKTTSANWKKKPKQKTTK